MCAEDKCGARDNKRKTKKKWWDGCVMNKKIIS